MTAIEAHPRVSGENVVNVYVTSENPGSSPRERGKPAKAEARTGVTGLIPA